MLDADQNEKCYGLMRVPISFMDDFEAIDKKGPRSWEAIAEGIKFLSKEAKCICEETSLSQRKTPEDIVRINEKAIAAYQVGYTNVPPTGGNDIKDTYDYDFSNDVIARAQFFQFELFKH